MQNRFRTMTMQVAFGLLVLLLPERSVHAELRLARPLTNHMVMQCGVTTPIWGWADAGQTIVVQIGDSRKTSTAKADGTWSVLFPARKASSRPLTIKISTGDQLLTVRDVLFGEVWLCAGQSNMEWPVSSSASATEALSTADHPNVRLLKVLGAARGGSGRYTPDHLAKMTADHFCEGRWEVCASETAKSFSAVGYYFGLALQQKLNVPVGLIDVSIGGTPAEAWVRRETLATHPQLKSLVRGNWLENDELGQWCRERATYNLSLAMKDGGKVPGDDLGPNHSFKPGFMWDSAVAPLIPFPIQGVVWYQGESNAQTDRRVRQHETIFDLLVTDWRKQFGLGEFPFLYVQLPGMGRPNWPEFREQQRQFLKSLPNVGMAVTIDLGHPTNVHPKNKKPVGQRLARWALANTYGDRQVVASGPLYRSMRVLGRQIVLSFDHAGSGLQASDGLPLRHFEIAGADGVFHPAEANIENGVIVVSHKNVEQPRHVRYAWIPFPRQPVNFYNREDLPASPFTTLKVAKPKS